jgi:hypothetical protein
LRSTGRRISWTRLTGSPWVVFGSMAVPPALAVNAAVLRKDGGRSLGCVSARVVAQRAKVRSEVG